MAATGPSQAVMRKLRAERETKKMSLPDVAGALHVSPALVGHYETGVRIPPDDEVVTRWVRLLGLSRSLVDDWVDARAEEQVAEVLGKLRGPRALPSEDVDAIRRSVRNALRGRR